MLAKKKSKRLQWKPGIYMCCFSKIALPRVLEIVLLKALIEIVQLAFVSHLVYDPTKAAEHAEHRTCLWSSNWIKGSQISINSILLYSCNPPPSHYSTQTPLLSLILSWSLSVSLFLSSLATVSICLFFILSLSCDVYVSLYPFAFVCIRFCIFSLFSASSTLDLHVIPSLLVSIRVWPFYIFNPFRAFSYTTAVSNQFFFTWAGPKKLCTLSSCPAFMAR